MAAAMTMVSINPATEEELGRFEEHSAEQVDAALDRAREAFRSWRDLSFTARAGYMTAAASQLRANKDRYARLATLEMGKPIIEAEAEIEKCAWNCDFFAEHAESMLAEERVASSATASFVGFRPLGVILAVMPWNFPFWQVFRFAAPTLMAGNTAMLKHASNVPQCALAIEQIFREVWLPEGVFQTLLVGGDKVAGLIADPRIAAVTLTGSDSTGSQVAEASGRVLKKTVLELGGSDPFIVLEDADLEAAAAAGCRARNQNNGQSCIAAKRFIVVDSIADEFEQRFTAAVAALKVGDPSQRDTQVGPLARGDLVDQLDRQVRETVAAGATVAVGGNRMPGPGYFYAPTVLGAVKPGMVAAREETFGPAAAVIRVRNEEDALAVANDSEFGLGATIWTRDVERGHRLAARIESGSVFINGMVASDPRLPFGGVKRSGYGRELSEFGIREFCNVQTVWIGPAVTEDKKDQAPTGGGD
jgi:succinate-semialdehyde dehydrogenase/glutarate-semialdehyde dehydrogenase